MKKFGFGNKRDGNEVGKKGSPAPSDNPYAQSQSSNDPYTNNPNQKYVTPYQQARANLGNNGPQAAGGPAQQPGGYGGPPQRNPSMTSNATAPPPYSETHQAPGGYGNDRFGTSSGYGGNRYAGAGAGGAGGAGARGPGGYGGFGRTNSDDTDANRDALFSGAQQRQTQQAPSSQAGAYGSPAGDGGSYGSGYGEQREMTEQEKEDLEVRKIRQETKDVRDASLASTENSLRTLEQTLGGGTETYARLARQNEMLHNTNQHLDRAAIANRMAKEKTAELKTLNRSMFAVHVSNPFTSKARKAEEEAKFLAQHREDRETREASRKEKYSQNARVEQSFKEISEQQRAVPASFSRANRADRYKYLDEDNSDDDEEKAAEAEKEDRIAFNQERMLGMTKQLNTLARGLGEEISSSNKLIDEIGSKSDRLDDGLAQRTRELNSFK